MMDNDGLDSDIDSEQGTDSKINKVPGYSSTNRASDKDCISNIHVDVLQDEDTRGTRNNTKTNDEKPANNDFSVITFEKETETSGDSRASVLLDHVVFCTVFTLVYTAFMATQNLETSINQEANVGFISLLCMYAIWIIVSVVAPSVVSNLGAKWTLVLGWFGQCAFLAANFYPIMPTMIPASLLLGTLSVPAWIVQGGYVTGNALTYAKVTGSAASPTLAKFHGSFWASFQTSQITGNLISSFVLYGGIENITDSTSSKYCGVQDVLIPTNISNNTSAPVSNPIRMDTIYTVMGVFLSLDVVALLITVCFIKPMKNTAPTPELIKNMADVLKQMTKLDIILLLPLFILNGYEQALLFVVITKNYITCSMGAQNVGFVMVTFGAANVIFCSITGPLTHYINRPIQLFMVTLLHLGIVVYLFLWRADTAPTVALYIVTGAWGICDGIWQSQTNAHIGYLFAESSAPVFAVFNAFRSAGFVWVTGMGAYLLTAPILYMFGGLIVVSYVTYIITEYRHRTRNRKQNQLDKMADKSY